MLHHLAGDTIQVESLVNYNCHPLHLDNESFTMFVSFVKGIENLAIILVPLIMILSRGHTGQIKG